MLLLYIWSFLLLSPLSGFCIKFIHWYISQSSSEKQNQKDTYRHERVLFWEFSSVQLSRSVMSNYLRPHGLQHARLPVHHQLLELSQTHVHRVSDVIQPSYPVVLFSCLQSFPASGTFLMSQLSHSSTGIPSPPLALFLVMLPKAHLTSHSRMSGSRWMITPSWLSGAWRSILYSSSVYSYHFFLLSSAYVRSIPFLSFIVPIFARNFPLVSLVFLKRLLAFPILLFSSISLHWSLRKAFLFLLAILWNSAFKWVSLSFSPLPFTSLLFTAICKASSDSYFAFLHFFFLGWSWSLPPYNVMNLRP